MKITIICLIVLLLVANNGALAADLNVVLTVPQDPVRGGGLVTLDLYLHNSADATITYGLPPSLPCRIITGQTTVAANAVRLDPDVQTHIDIPGQSFAKRQYAVRLPVYASGSVRIVLETVDTNPLLILVEKAPPEAWVGQQVPLDEGPTMLQSFIEDLSVYEPMYFLLGVDPGLEQSKFQFSFKYRLFNPKGYLAEIAPWVTGFHLGYTQRSIWDLKGDSKPFDDTSYMPEAFYSAAEARSEPCAHLRFRYSERLSARVQWKGRHCLTQHQLSLYQTHHGNSPHRSLSYENRP
jgi:phospholipase A1